MTDFFLGIVSLSLSASWLVAAVMAFRFLLKKAPKAMHVALWGLVALRLLLPVSFESTLSLVPEDIGNGTVVESWTQTPVISHTPAVRPGSDTIQSGPQTEQNPPASPNTTVHPDSTPSEYPAITPTVGDILVPALSSIWILGMGVMALYAIGSYVTLWWQIRTAVRLERDIYQSEFAPTAFVLGLLRPRIYVPYDMADADLVHVIAHERAHIDRKDHWWKPMGYLLLSIHWFNPLMWAAYALLCRDIELACDEQVIRSLKQDQRADYSQTLLTCSIHQKMILACPVAFGQAGIKERVRNVLTYRKPGLWITLVTVAAMVVSMVCFFTVPPAQAEGLDTPPANQTPNIPDTPVDPGEPNVGSSVTLTTGDGIEYTVSATSVTPVGMRLSVDVDVKCTFLIYNYYWIERQTENGWEALPAMMEDPCHMASRFGASGNNIFPGPTDTRPVDWSGIYGVLEPSTYRLCTVVFEDEEPCSVEFTIGDPGDSTAAQALQRYYAALDKLLNQENYHVVNTYSSIEDPTVDVDADANDYNDMNIYEYMRSGDDYLKQDWTYTTDLMSDGVMIRDGIEYRVENEMHGTSYTPAIGWAQWPGAKSDYFTRWVSCYTMKDLRSAEMTDNTIVLDLKCTGNTRSSIVTIAIDGNGNLERIDQVTEYGPTNTRSSYTSTYTLTVMDTDTESIARIIESQDVEFLRDFTWTGTQPEDETIADREFVNTEAVALDTVSDVIDHAKKECSVTYTNIMVYYDAEAMVWKVEFWVGYGMASIEVVYLNAEGTTLLITNREPIYI